MGKRKCYRTGERLGREKKANEKEFSVLWIKKTIGQITTAQHLSTQHSLYICVDKYKDVVAMLSRTNNHTQHPVLQCMNSLEKGYSENYKVCASDIGSFWFKNILLRNLYNFIGHKFFNLFYKSFPSISNMVARLLRWHFDGTRDYNTLVRNTSIIRNSTCICDLTVQEVRLDRQTQNFRLTNPLRSTEKDKEKFLHANLVIWG